MADKIQFRRDTKARWEQFNPILMEGEVGYVLDDANLYKIGDGTKAWNSLPYRGFDGTLAQETGESENAVMSQKAVTDEISKLASNTFYKGVATPSTTPGTPDGNVFYFASEKGIYPNFDNLEVKNESLIFYWNGSSWNSQSTGLPSLNLFPFKLLDSTTRPFKDAIKELYFLIEKTEENQYILNSFRRAQVSTDWGGVTRWEINIRNFTTGAVLFGWVSFSHNEGISGIQEFGNSNVKIIVDWNKIPYGSGYGQTLASYELSDDCFSELQNPIIAQNIRLSQNETDIESVKKTRNVSPEWFEGGLFSTEGGGVNPDPSQSHTDYIEAHKAEKIVASQSIYRINLYKSDQTFISQASFLGGTEFILPNIAEIGLIRISSMTAYTSNTTTIEISSNDIRDNTFRIANLEQAVSQVWDNFEKAQSHISPDNSEVIDFSNYVVNGSVNSHTGEIDLLTNRRSIEKYPIDDSKFYGVYNTLDTESNKRVAVFDDTGTLLRILDVVDMKSWVFSPRAGDSYISITLISLYGEPNVNRFEEIKFFELYENQLAITKINGVPIKSTDSAALDKHLAEVNPHGITATLLNAITEVNYGGSPAPKNGSTVTIENSTQAKSGLMSKEDKAKLDGISVSPVNITGSGVTKNASAYGFLPTATAAENVTALQNAVLGGGTILVDYPGTYLVNGTILLDSNTKIIFGANVFISMQAPNRFLLNRGALTREYNENIHIVGLNLITNGNGVTAVITGLRGYIAFFYIKKLIVQDFTLLDGASGPYVIHVCRFENAQFLNIHIEGRKDAIHIGTGSKFVIRHGLFKTYDDPIALNAHDYTSGQPEYGWIEDGIIEDCYDLNDVDTVGYFARILAGAWVDWYSGMSIQSSGDTVVSNGRMYKSNGPINSDVFTSTIQPTFASGTQTLADGITWTMMQENNITHTAGVRRVTFRNIYLQKPRGTAFSIHFDKDMYSRSYYPGAESPVQEDLLFDGIFYNAELTNLISCITPINSIKVVNSILGNTKIALKNVGTAGIRYGTTNVLLSNVTFKGSGAQNLIESDIPSTVKIVGSIIEDNSYDPKFSGDVTRITNEL